MNVDELSYFAHYLFNNGLLPEGLDINKLIDDFVRKDIEVKAFEATRNKESPLRLKKND